jgi:hypothetical protein
VARRQHPLRSALPEHVAAPPGEATAFQDIQRVGQCPVAAPEDRADF